MGALPRVDRRHTSSTGVGAVAIALLAACNAMSGIEGLSVGPGDESPRAEASQDSDVREVPSPSTRRTTSADAGSGPRDPTAPTSPADPSGEAPVVDASVDASPAEPVAFVDAFSRPDGASIGNGWLEKENVFSLAGGAVAGTAGAGSYVDRFVRRPAAESALDVTLSVDVTFGTSVDADPTLYARVQGDSDEKGILTGYTFYAYADLGAIVREEGATATELASVAIAPELVPGRTYRFLFRVRGTGPVQLDGAITTVDGAPVGSLNTTDGSANRIIRGGQFGFGASDGARMRWDNFRSLDR